MKLALSIVVALGLVIGLWWTRDRGEITNSVEPSAPASPAQSRRIPTIATRPVLANQERRLEPTAADPDLRKAQEELRQELRRFASEAELTDAQWDQFERDLSELAATESAAWANGVKARSFDGIIELNEELGPELEARCTDYMTKKQLSTLRFRFHTGGLVTRVRQLHFVPVMIPEP